MRKKESPSNNTDTGAPTSYILHRNIIMLQIYITYVFYIYIKLCIYT